MNVFIKMHEENKINSWIAAIILCFPIINATIGINGSSVITLLFICFLCLLGILRNEFRIKSSVIILVSYILIIFCISFMRLDNWNRTMSYLMYFIVFDIIAYLAGIQNISEVETMQNMQRIGIICLVVLTLRGMEHLDSGHLMGLSYSFLPVLFSSVIFIEKSSLGIAIVNIFLISWHLIKIAPRGVLLAITFFIAWCVFYKLCFIKNKRQRVATKILWIVIAGGVCLVIIMNLNEIILGIGTFLSDTFGIKIYALEKYASYLKKGNLSNGRDILFNQAYMIIKDNFLFGNGIGYFETVTNGSYVHNIFLQALCEAGVFFLIPICVIIVKSVFRLIFSAGVMGYVKYLFYVMSVTCGLVSLFYSSVYWILIYFWFFLGYSFTSNKQISS